MEESIIRAFCSISPNHKGTCTLSCMTVVVGNWNLLIKCLEMTEKKHFFCPSCFFFIERRLKTLILVPTEKGKKKHTPSIKTFFLTNSIYTRWLNIVYNVSVHQSLCYKLVSPWLCVFDSNLYAAHDASCDLRKWFLPVSVGLTCVTWNSCEI